MNIATYQNEFLNYLKIQNLEREPKSLYRPIKYILQLEGKRIRPILTLMAADVFSNDYKNALPVAMAIEIFHTFTLVHDDIMDGASIRRKKQTVHTKWNLNTAILSGDAMLILAYQYFENYSPIIFQKLAKLFTKTALEVCKGQQLDIDFEIKDNVTISEYIKMISLKTSVLLASALKMGAIVSKADEIQAQNLYNYGLNLGIAFQLQDDYLDTFGNSKNFGKQIGIDIIENKKTFLYLKSLELSNSSDKEILLSLFSKKSNDNSEKIKIVKQIYNKHNITNIIKTEIELYTQKAFKYIDLMNITNTYKNHLKNFGENLMCRNI